MKLPLFYIAILLLSACKTEIDIYAPPIEAYYVVGVLDPARDTQFVRMSRVFQSPGDAYVYADTAELSVRGWDAELRGGGRIWQAIEVEVPVDSGLFGGAHHVYAFITDSTARLRADTRYDLRLRKPDDSTFLISAWTRIPTEPVLTSPSQPTYSASTNTFGFPTWEFDKDVDIAFEKGSGFGFETRIWLYYLENGMQKAVFWGPSRLRKAPFRCSATLEFNQMCIEIPGPSVPNHFRTIIEKATGQIEFPDTTRFANQIELLSRVARVEVAAADSFLARFLIGNDPNVAGINLLMDRQEYTNLSNGNYGIFGSIHKSSQWVFLGECTKYLSGLTPFPPTGCP